MIRHIKGQYLYYDKGAVVVESEGGIGFRVFVADTSPVLNAREGDIIQLYTYMQVKEDGMSLFGFSDRDSLDLFEQLLTVNSVGPKAALAIMSTGTANQIKGYILHKDGASIAKAKGIGKKTAERIIMELADKVSAVPMTDEEFATPAGAELFSDERNNAVLALTTLGYSKSEAEEAIGHVAEEDLTVEEYIKKSLKYLM